MFLCGAMAHWMAISGKHAIRLWNVWTSSSFGQQPGEIP